MKKLITIMFLTISVNSFASAYVMTSLLPSQSIGLSSASLIGNNGKIEAEQVIRDSQDLAQTGELSVFLNQKIKELQSQDNLLSEQDALDQLIAVSEAILN